MKIARLLLVFLFIFLSACSSQRDYIKINNTKIEIIKVAKSHDDKYQGLSFKKSICENCGMLFVYDDKKERGYVMRNMLFPLDMIWIANGEVININKNLLPEGGKTKNVYMSGSEMDSVLEVNAGFSSQHNIKVGDKIIYQIENFNEN